MKPYSGPPSPNGWKLHWSHCGQHQFLFRNKNDVPPSFSAGKVRGPIASRAQVNNGAWCQPVLRLALVVNACQTAARGARIVTACMVTMRGRPRFNGDTIRCFLLLLERHLVRSSSCCSLELRLAIPLSRR
jgi:hypothetical protein